LEWREWGMSEWCQGSSFLYMNEWVSLARLRGTRGHNMGTNSMGQQCRDLSYPQ
jgi:hypothetical protein